MDKKRKKHMPTTVLNELDSIKSNYDLHKDSEALRKMSELSKVGREFDTMRSKFMLHDVWGKKKKK